MRPTVWSGARSRLTLLGAASFVAACAGTPPPAPHGAPPYMPPAPPLARTPVPATPPSAPASRLEPAAVPAPAPAGLATLEGWEREDHAAALRAFQAGCGVAVPPALKAACARARALGRADESASRRFFEQAFRAEPLAGEGVLTAYFAPAYEARSAPEGAYSAPVRPVPADLFLVDLGVLDASLAGRRLAAKLSGGALSAYPDRAVIETVPPSAPALAWMRPEDLFFLQIQGSGVLSFPDGRRLKAAYAGDNGRPFVAIARPMVEAGMLARDRASGDAIRGWLAAHPGPPAEAVMRKNPRYVFFSLSPDDGAEPPGAAGVPLTPGRSIAIDPGRHGYGGLYWLDASAPVLTGAQASYRRLVVALDTGAAIRGEVRADLYTGRGDAAGREAGRVRHTLRMTQLVPVDAALGAAGEAHAAP